MSPCPGGYHLIRRKKIKGKQALYFLVNAPVSLFRSEIDVFGERKSRLLIDTRIAALAERVHLDVHVLILAHDFQRLFVRVERVHENERHVASVPHVQRLSERGRR